MTAIEFDAEFAARARANFAQTPRVGVVHGDGTRVMFEPADFIHVNAGATRPADTLLERLKEGPTGDRVASYSTSRLALASREAIDSSMGRREQKWLSPEGFTPLLPPATDALVEEFGVARVALPGFGKFGAVAARATIARQVVEAYAHR